MSYESNKKIKELSQIMQANGIKMVGIKNNEEEMKVELFPPGTEIIGIVFSDKSDEEYDTIFAPLMGLAYITDTDKPCSLIRRHTRLWLT